MLNGWNQRQHYTMIWAPYWLTNPMFSDVKNCSCRLMDIRRECLATYDSCTITQPHNVQRVIGLMHLVSMLVFNSHELWRSCRYVGCPRQGFIMYEMSLRFVCPCNRYITMTDLKRVPRSLHQGHTLTSRHVPPVPMHPAQHQCSARMPNISRM
jgi:hypothetical protein